MLLYNFFPATRTNPVTVHNHHKPSVIEDVLSRQYAIMQHWYKHLVPHAHNLTDEAAVDIIENSFMFKLVVDLPGASAGECDISITGHQITIKASKNPVSIDDEDHYVLRERQNNTLQRSVVLPENADMDHAAATLSCGLLVIEVPKLSEAQSKKQVAVTEIHKATKMLPVKAAA